MENEVYDKGADEENTRSGGPSSLNSNQVGQSGGGATSPSTGGYEPAIDHIRQSERSGASGSSIPSLPPGQARQASRVPTSELRAAENPGTSRSELRKAAKIPNSDPRGVPSHEYDGEAKRIPFANARGSQNRFSPFTRLSRTMKKRLILLVAPVAGIFAIIIVFLLILGGSLKLPTLMQNIIGYQFARATSQFASDSALATDESLALDATSKSVFGALKQRFTTGVSNIRESTWGKLDNYRPEKVLQTLSEDKGLKFNYEATRISGRPVLRSIEYGGNVYEVPEVTGIAKWVPGLNKLLETKNNTATLATSDILSQANKDMGVGVPDIVRGSVMNKIISLADSSRIGLILRNFKGMNSEDAQTEASIQMYDATQAGATISDNAVTGEIISADSAVSNATKTEVQGWVPTCTGGYSAVAFSSSAGSATCSSSSSSTSTSPGSTPATSSSTSELEHTISTGIDLPAEQALKSSVGGGIFKTALDFVDPVYSIATPLCLIYDGSVKNSQPSIDNQMNQEQNTFDKLAAEAGQQERGDLTSGDTTELARGIGGVNAEIGNITHSIPYMRSEGQKINTSGTPQVEAGSDGSYVYSLVNALGLSGPVATVINTGAGTFCPYLTNTLGAIGLTVANTAATVASGGGWDVAEESASVPAWAFIKNFASTFLESIAPKTIVKDGVEVPLAGLSRLGNFIKGTAKNLLAIGGLTVLAKLVVAARAGAVTNGLAQGSSLANMADSGANIEANKVSQSQEFGRPLLASEVAHSNQRAITQIARANASKSFVSRYFSINNADSLITHVAIDLSGAASSGIFNSIIKFASALFHPLSEIGSLIHLSGVASAATPVSAVNQTYGNVQFGWSQSEERLIQSSSSYKPLENQQILTESNMEQQIAQKYAVCFGYKYNPNGNGDLDPNDSNGNLQLSNSASLGHLLASGDIARSHSGNVINSSGALCSPQNLSYNSPDPLANDPYSPNGMSHDLIFRWRLAMSYLTTLDQLNSMQSITSSNPGSPANTTPTVPSSPSGYQNPFRSVKNLAQERVDQGVDYSGSGPVYAIGQGKVLSLVNSGWHGGTFISYELLSGPVQGKYVYIAENCNNIQVHIGEQVSSNTVLCDMVDAAPNIETGWANGSALGEAAAYSAWLNHPKLSYTAYGKNFSDLLKSLGAPPGIIYSGGQELGSLPAGWPTW